MGGTILYTFLRRSFLATDAIVKICEVIAETEKLGYQSTGARKKIEVFRKLAVVWTEHRYEGAVLSNSDVRV